jgi:hypothetical protein
MTPSVWPGQGDRLVSVLVPVAERPEPLASVYEEYSAPLRQMEGDFEFVFILQPGQENLRGPLENLIQRGEPVRVLQSARALDEAGQLRLAEAASRGDILVTLPAYHRVEARCLQDLVERVEASAHLAVARRWPRRDGLFNRLQNRVFHSLLGAASNRSFHDVACGVRAMRREVLNEVPLYGGFSRFLPILATQEGFNVEEIPCAQHPRDAGLRVYSVGTYLRRMVDILGVLFLVRFAYKPLRFFGLLGGGLSTIGGVILIVVAVQRLLGQALANRPVLLLGLLLFTVGVQVIALGLVGELIVHLQAGGPSYRGQETTPEDIDRD